MVDESDLLMSDEQDMREAYYHWVLSDICDMIRAYGYTKVLIDIDRTLKNEDLEIELKQTVGE